MSSDAQSTSNVRYKLRLRLAKFKERRRTGFEVGSVTSMCLLDRKKKDFSSFDHAPKLRFNGGEYLAV